jgi:hypothetical protein
MWRGDSHTIVIEVRDSDGNPVDLSAATARWWMGKNSRATGSNIYIQKDATITSSGGVWFLNVAILPEDTEELTKTGTFYHEAEVILSGNVSTVTVGDFVLMPDIIRTVP